MMSDLLRRALLVGGALVGPLLVAPPSAYG